MKYCPNCNMQIDDEVLTCDNCGYVFPLKTKNSTKKIVLIIIVVTIIVLLAFIGKNVYDYYTRENYKQKVYECTYEMVTGAADAEDICNTIVSVWYNSVWEIYDSETDKYTIDSTTGYFYEDFNDALMNLYSDDTFVDDIDNLNDSFAEVNNSMKELQNPPKGCEKMHESFMEFYDSYYELMNCALDPHGSLNTYSDRFNDADEELGRRFFRFQVYLD